MRALRRLVSILVTGLRIVTFGGRLCKGQLARVGSCSVEAQHLRRQNTGTIQRVTEKRFTGLGLLASFLKGLHCSDLLLRLGGLQLILLLQGRTMHTQHTHVLLMACIEYCRDEF